MKPTTPGEGEVLLTRKKWSKQSLVTDSASRMLYIYQEWVVRDCTNSSWTNELTMCLLVDEESRVKLMLLETTDSSAVHRMWIGNVNAPP